MLKQSSIHKDIHLFATHLFYVYILFLSRQEGEGYLRDHGRPDEDVVTRGQQRKLDDIYDEEPASKAPRLAKASTMTETVAVSLS